MSTGLKIKEGSFDILIPHLISFVDTNRNSFKLAEIWQEENIPNPVNLAKMLTSLDKDYLDEFCCRLYAYFQEFHNTDMLR